MGVFEILAEYIRNGYNIGGLFVILGVCILFFGITRIRLVETIVPPGSNSPTSPLRNFPKRSIIFFGVITLLIGGGILFSSTVDNSTEKGELESQQNLGEGQEYEHRSSGFRFRLLKLYKNGAVKYKYLELDTGQWSSEQMSACGDVNVDFSHRGVPYSFALDRCMTREKRVAFSVYPAQ